MEHPNISVRRTGIKYGILTGLAIIGYFLLLVVTGLDRVLGLHFLAGLILVAGVTIAINNFKVARNGHIEYFQGIGLGLAVGLVSTIMYALVQVIGDYVSGMAFTEAYRSGEMFGSDLSVWFMAVTWIIFGVILGPFIAYIAMQFYRNSGKDDKLKR